MGSSGKQGDFDMKNELLKGKLSLVLDDIKRSTAPMPTVLKPTGKTLQFNLAESVYIIGVREGQTKSSATANHGGY